ncbi:MAG TPA: ROK family protein [Anaerolineaceae bacterium]|jgi:polyphosphate glucokinase|nr:ROK family protein [Longilinea sp.]HOU43439.1 ROK family protein [Anaerolineaceae bacterium]HQF44276.1 ROK family protein [Anaerolineaceae bacterium]HQH34166.1 ROK family protein [Anaerolineaceae bacterium]HQJ02842.1 ROK family protein [Anaerolineaceae bacterium]
MSVLGIDIGGSGIKGAIVDVETGKLLTPRERIPTPENAKPEDVAQVVKTMVEFFHYEGSIGAGFPAVIRNGIALTAANVHKSWIGLDANILFSSVTKCPVSVVNDADAAGIAEMRFGIGRDYPRGVVIFLTIGTGIGSAIFTDGHLVPNTEFGHLEMGGKDAEHRASDAARQEKEMSWKRWAKALNDYLNEIHSLFWPDLIVLGGGISRQAEKFLPFLDVPVKVLPAKLENQAGIIGAALHAAEQGR